MSAPRQRRGRAAARFVTRVPSIRCPVVFFIALTPGLAMVRSAHAQGRSLTLDDVIGLRVISEARIAPDASAVAYVLLEPDAQMPVGWRVSLWRVDVESGESSKLADDARTPRWSPDGRRLAFISRGEAGAAQIWTVDGKGGGVVRLSDSPTDVASYEWSPDGASIAFVAVDPASLRSSAPVARVEGEAGASRQLYLLDVGEGQARQLTEVDGTVHVDVFGNGSSISWSPDGTRIAFAVQPGSSFEDAFHSDVEVVEVASGRVRALVARRGLDFRPRWSPDGRWIAFTSSFGAIDRLGSHGVSVVAAHGDEPRDIGARHGQAFLDAPAVLDWSDDGRRLYYEAPRGATRQLVAITVADGELSSVTSGDAVHSGFSFSGDGSRMAFLGAGPGRPYDVFVTGVDRFEPRRITEVNAGLRGVAMPGMEVIDWENATGRRVEGVLVKPPGFEIGRRYPLIVWLHGGPEGHAVLAFDPTVPFPLAGFDPSPIQLLAARGYLVLLPNFRGSAGYGLDFTRSVVGELGAAPLADVEAGIDHLVRNGLADAERVGVMGWASGGYKVADFITASRRFAAAALGAAPTDLWLAYGEGDFPVQWESLMGGAPWEVPDRYDRDSPVRHAQRAVTPTLLMHGEDDPLVPAIHSRQLYTMLRRAGVATMLVTYPGQGHGILHPDARKDAMRRILEWFDRWMQGGARE